MKTGSGFGGGTGVGAASFTGASATGAGFGVAEGAGLAGVADVTEPRSAGWVAQPVASAKRTTRTKWRFIALLAGSGPGSATPPHGRRIIYRRTLSEETDGLKGSRKSVNGGRLLQRVAVDGGEPAERITR
jgi:hypothetical protein